MLTSGNLRQEKLYKIVFDVLQSIHKESPSGQKVFVSRRDPRLREGGLYDFSIGRVSPNQYAYVEIKLTQDAEDVGFVDTNEEGNKVLYLALDTPIEDMKRFLLALLEPTPSSAARERDCAVSEQMGLIIEDQWARP